MALKFRKRVKIVPGVTVNLSKSGVSGTFGAKGASVNVGKKGTYLNTGIPGTGIYDRQRLDGKSNTSTDNNISYVCNNEEPSYSILQQIRRGYRAALLAPGENLEDLSAKVKEFLGYIVMGLVVWLFWAFFF
ncbi:DUF4236 domain-containing protein [Testudinibacter sp. TR-2022]|uniref:DUF4236 domain-containing protein n=1 Tax=Testudinibacter sp. TR-2022 TaxID=2585029 RepID=UPI001119E728|nr:DUF4236 domain-containing protein [Testudinibacter sp. TR-2022]TNH04504.1 DUF4236 domain-containing protein [Pasteurellaceae bacterium Phil31]TNH11974.1 DUF4236 domain-containing protein [Testudinibacter sp. TR-2022]TNH12721.1 DUF4236 domain-containing protein [Testudinibacter sp. TR-2022]TNH13686.1 DUF4236 domain-containing protein [Testudinibacter sp. TR-2022]TNH17232.1 DUF4236 domain-containing protein [Testudinibacter sp. TR-2022]